MGSLAPSCLNLVREEAAILLWYGDMGLTCAWQEDHVSPDHHHIIQLNCSTGTIRYYHCDKHCRPLLHKTGFFESLKAIREGRAFAVKISTVLGVAVGEMIHCGR